MTFNPIRQELATRQTRFGALFSREVEARLKEAVRPHRKTGELERSISAEVVGSLPTGSMPIPELTIRAQATAPQGRYLEDGTRPHEIRGNPVLAFYWEKVGRFVFFHHVNHPGTTARPWFAPTLRESVTLVRDLWRRL